MRESPSPSDPASAWAGVDEAQRRLAVLERAVAQAQRLSTLGTLSAGVAHEINNILTPVLSYAHLARTRPDDRELQERAYEKVISGVESACRVVQSILSYARDPEERDEADPGEALDAAIGCLGRDPAKSGIVIGSRIAPGTCIRIRPLALQQILLNLVLNACSALHGRKGSINVEAAPSGHGQVRLVVSDDGPGIPPEVLPTLFEPFVTSRSTPQNQPAAGPPGGSGLGLMVVRHLVETARGTIEVTSTPGQGATFTMVLPAAQASRAMAG